MPTSLTYEIVQERIHHAQADIERNKAAIEDATKRIDILHGEIGDLLGAARVLARLDGVPVVQSNGTPSIAIDDDFDPNEGSGNPYRPLTNKAFMWQILKETGKVWLTANEIQELATRLRGSEIPMSSVSPGLSDMKQDGTIERDGMKVALKSRLNENGAPKGAPDAGEVAASTISNRIDHVDDLLG